MNDLLTQLLGPLDGYKTMIAAVGLVALGVYKLTQKDFEGGAQSIAAGLAALGLRHAITKAADPTATTIAPPAAPPVVTPVA